MSEPHPMVGTPDTRAIGTPDVRTAGVEGGYMWSPADGGYMWTPAGPVASTPTAGR